MLIYAFLGYFVGNKLFIEVKKKVTTSLMKIDKKKSKKIILIGLAILIPIIGLIVAMSHFIFL